LFPVAYVCVSKHSWIKFIYPHKRIKLYRTIIFTVVLYGCETWSLTLREVHKVRVFENRVMRRIFGPKREEVAGANCIIWSFITSVFHRILLG